MIVRVCELWSPSQIGPAIRMMSAGSTQLAVDPREVVAIVALGGHVGPDAGRDDVIDRADDVDLDPDAFEETA